MTPERQKKLRDSLNWEYDPDCLCGICTEYRDGLVEQSEPAIASADFAIVGEGFTEEWVDVRPGSVFMRDARRLAAPPAKVGGNAMPEGGSIGSRLPRLAPLPDKITRRDLSDGDKRKATPIFSGVMRYFPAALAAVARLSKAGNDKHNPGEPLHWARGKSTDHGDCIARHQITYDQIDEETGEYHAAAVAWRALAQLQLLEETKAKRAA